MRPSAVAVTTRRPYGLYDPIIKSETRQRGGGSWSAQTGEATKGPAQQQPEGTHESTERGGSPKSRPLGQGGTGAVRLRRTWPIDLAIDSITILVCCMVMSMLNLIHGYEHVSSMVMSMLKVTHPYNERLTLSRKGKHLKLFGQIIVSKRSYQLSSFQPGGDSSFYILATRGWHSREG